MCKARSAGHGGGAEVAAASVAVAEDAAFPRPTRRRPTTTPRHDIPAPRERFAARRQRGVRQGLLERMARRFLHPRGRGNRRGAGGEGVPVDPNRPNTLTGGAAASLDFDE